MLTNAVKDAIVEELGAMLRAWWKSQEGKPLPATRTLKSICGEVYVRRGVNPNSPGCRKLECLQIARISFGDGFRGRGIWTKLAKMLQYGPWQVVKVESVLNIRFAVKLRRTGWRKDPLSGEDCPSFYKESMPCTDPESPSTTTHVPSAVKATTLM